MDDALIFGGIVLALVLFGFVAGHRHKKHYTQAVNDVRKVVHGESVWVTLMAGDTTKEVTRAIRRAKENGMLGYFCSTCSSLVFASDGNFGPHQCPCCGSETLAQWGRVRTLELEPEDTWPG